MNQVKSINQSNADAVIHCIEIFNIPSLLRMSRPFSPLGRPLAVLVLLHHTRVPTEALIQKLSRRQTNTIFNIQYSIFNIQNAALQAKPVAIVR